MRASELRFDTRQQRQDSGVGQVAEVSARLRRRHPVAQQLHADLELAVMHVATQAIEHVLEVHEMREAGLDLCPDRIARRHGRIEIAAEHSFEQADAAAEVLGETRRAAHDLGDLVQQSGPRVEQRE